MATAIAIAVHC